MDKINRRAFCEKTLLAGATIPFFSALKTDNFLAESHVLQYRSIELPLSAATKLPIPEGHRIAFKMNYFTLDTSDQGLIIKTPAIPANFKGMVYLRLQVAIDTRAMDEVEVSLAKTGKKIGQFSIWYPTGLQIFETRIDCDPATLAREGIRLRMINGTTPLFFLASTPTNGSHFLLADNKTKFEPTWHQTLCSERSLQPFCWLEGCGLDGLHELYLRKNDRIAYKALQKHLDSYLIDNQNLIYVDLWSRPRDNTFTNLETGNNFAIIAKHRPNHPAVGLYLDYCKRRFDSNLKILPDQLTQEGLYTLAYPLTVLAEVLKKPELFEMGLIEAEERIKYLTTEDSIYRMGHRIKGVEERDRNWSRGVVWFLLGLARTTEQLLNSPLKEDPRVARLVEAYKHNANIVLRHQQKDHSWKAFLHLQETFFETSATAGLAAALAHGHRLGWLPEFDQFRLNQVYQRLLKSMTPDGFLTHTTQHNAGSYELMQMGEYRVISQYTLGFVGQIKAHLS